MKIKIIQNYINFLAKYEAYSKGISFLSAKKASGKKLDNLITYIRVFTPAKQGLFRGFAYIFSKFFFTPLKKRSLPRKALFSVIFRRG